MRTLKTAFAASFPLSNLSKACSLLNDVIIEFYGYFKKFINTKNIRFSPIHDELTKLYLDFEKIIRTVKNSRGSLYAHSQSMLSIKESKYFHEISQFFDGNCRRNKRIINVYGMIKNILGDHSDGKWYFVKRLARGMSKIASAFSGI